MAGNCAVDTGVAESYTYPFMADSDSSARLFCPLCMATYADAGYSFCRIDGARLRPLSELGSGWVGRMIGEKYRIVSFLGAGAMAEVYEALDLTQDKRVAIKLMQRHLAQNATMMERFKREARLISLISHPNVVEVHDYGTLDDGTIFMVMELLLGRSLEEALVQEPLSPVVACEVGIQACKGLQAAHDKSIVHRDIKPSNLFLPSTGNDSEFGAVSVKLLDLGIAKLQGEGMESNLTATGTIFGTPEYMSPEQALGRPVDARSDVYALGVVLYRMFVGRVPFCAESFLEILTKHASEAPVWPEEAARERNLPGSAGEVVLRALQKNPDQRQQSMRELQAELVELRARLPVGPTTAPTVPDLGHTLVDRHRSNASRTIGLDQTSPQVDSEIVELAPDVFWVGRREGVLLERNIYLRVYRNAAAQLNVIIDPGPPKDLDSLAKKVGAIIGSIEKVDIVFLNHQDPDVSANASAIQSMNPRAHIWCSEDTWRLAHFYGLRRQSYSAIEDFPDRRTHVVTGHSVRFLPTPYCHFRGAVMYYDEASRILFSGDLFAGVSLARGFVATSEDWQGIEIFHQTYMPSSKALRLAVQSIRRLDPAPVMIAPQHGGVIVGERIGEFLDQMERLQVGFESLLPEQGTAIFLRAANQLAQAMLALHGPARAAAELRSFAADGSFPNLFVFAGEHTIAEIKIDPRAALRAFLARMKAVTTPAEGERLQILVAEILGAHALDRAAS